MNFIEFIKKCEQNVSKILYKKSPSNEELSKVYIREQTKEKALIMKTNRKSKGKTQGLIRAL
jgi:hypothetical protein